MFTTQSPSTDLGRMMTGGKPAAERRRAGDFFPTPPEVTQALIARHSHVFDAKTKATVWEPCCGDWAMAKVFESMGHRVIGSDIVPRSEKGIVLDILKDDPPGDFDIIVTNPPFDILEAVLRRVVPLAPWVALLTKSTFWHASTRAALWDEFRPTYVHPLRWRPDFLSLGSPTMDVSWLVWDHGMKSDACIYDPLDRPGRKRPAKASDQSVVEAVA